VPSSWARLLLVALGPALAAGCSIGRHDPAPGTSAGPATASASPAPPSGPAGSASPAPATVPAATAIAMALADAGGATDAGALDGDDPMASHVEDQAALLGLFAIRHPPKPGANADRFLDKTFGVGGPSRSNQGNKALAHHAISKAKCLEGLAGVVFQTDEQKQICGGLPNMVPIFKAGKKPKACIDVFEFPNAPCELPFVWIGPTQARRVCELQGKRLCSQEEWTLACRGDPDGGPDRKYAYGDDLDLSVCNTNKSASSQKPACDDDSSRSAWKTCETNTEPAGAFPKCKSRFGVYDQHGNVAEIMTRLDPDGHTYSQLKGSAFFYVDVARRPEERQKEGRETYPDHCAYDARWHVEPIEDAWHVNYHLGFRCCKTVR
jgi:hypothetical protein